MYPQRGTHMYGRGDMDPFETTSSSPLETFGILSLRTMRAASFLVDLSRFAHAVWRLWSVSSDISRFIACPKDTFTSREDLKRFLHRFWELKKTRLTHGELDIQHLQRCAIAWHQMPYLGLNRTKEDVQWAQVPLSTWLLLTLWSNMMDVMVV